MGNVTRYPYDDLVVVGFAGSLGPRERPQILEPLYAVAASGDVLVPPYHDEHGCVVPTGVTSYGALGDRVEGGEAVLLEPPKVARVDGCLLAPVGDGPPSYVTRTRAHADLLEYAREKRRVGDEHWRSREPEAALAAYELAAAVSQESKDYARILLCAVSRGRRDRLNKWIRGQGSDPVTLDAQLRSELETRSHGKEKPDTTDGKVKALRQSALTYWRRRKAA